MNNGEFQGGLVRLRDPRILVSARDAGAAGHVGAIAGALTARGATLAVVAQPPALALLRAAGQSAVDVDDWVRATIPPSKWQADFLPLVEEAMHCFRPDCLLLGQSQRTEFSIDDWLLAVAGDVPVAVMQDFWGEVKPVRGKFADMFLVMDEFAREVTERKAFSETVVVGAPKYAGYARLDVSHLRSLGRSAAGLVPADHVIGYFGQDLMRVAGYRSTLRDIARAVRGCQGAKLLYRPHPREKPRSVEHTLSTFAAEGVRAILFAETPIEVALTTVDVVASCFSTCGYDALNLARCFGELPLVVVYADYNPEVKRFWAEHAGIDQLPAVGAGAALEAADSRDLARIFQESRRPEFKAAVNARVRAAVPDPAAAPEAAADAILALAARRSAVRSDSRRRQA